MQVPSNAACGDLMVVGVLLRLIEAAGDGIELGTATKM